MPEHKCNCKGDCGDACKCFPKATVDHANEMLEAINVRSGAILYQDWQNNNPGLTMEQYLDLRDNANRERLADSNMTTDQVHNLVREARDFSKQYIELYLKYKPA